MKTYKVVPFANTVVVEKNGNAQQAIVDYFDVINQECVGGWEFHSLAPISVTRKDGGRDTIKEEYNAFIFVKEI